MTSNYERVLRAYYLLSKCSKRTSRDSHAVSFPQSPGKHLSSYRFHPVDIRIVCLCSSSPISTTSEKNAVDKALRISAPVESAMTSPDPVRRKGVCIVYISIVKSCVL